jgi:C_GCAxxG_C_C family probable redox protein
VERAVQNQAEGCNCCQAVIAAYGPGLGFDRQASLNVAMAFGGGIAHTGKTCGAATGALMVLGLHVAKANLSLGDAKTKANRIGSEFLSRFRKRTGYTDCADFLGCHIGSIEGMKRIHDKNLLKTVCPKIIRAAAEILEEMLKTPVR